MDRTGVAVALAAFITFAAVAGLGVFLGFGAGGSLVTGAVLGLLAGTLIWAAARRADSFHDRDIPPVEPGFPGPPEHEDERQDDGPPEDAGGQEPPADPADGEQRRDRRDHR
jgi:hypothetical protein